MTPWNSEILQKSIQKSINVGMAGYAATGFQVCSMMWLRTTMNYQFKNGGSTFQTIKLLYKEGGIPRFYRGVSFALINAPLSRFGDTASNRPRASFTASLDSTGHTWLMQSASQNFLDSPSTTSATTYSLKIGGNGSATIYINRSSRDNNATNEDGRYASTITLMEISA